MPDHKICAKCRFYKAKSMKHGEFQYGECRRWPPKPEKMDQEKYFQPPINKVERSFPMSYADDWCGEWKSDAVAVKGLREPAYEGEFGTTEVKVGLRSMDKT